MALPRTDRTKTSLASQLRHLEKSTTVASSVIDKIGDRDKRKSSLLFSPADAAALSFEEVHAIGSQGLAELLAEPVLDPLSKRGLERSSRKLFAHAAVSYDRSAASAEENGALDRRLRAFLIRLSPYLPLTCAHKCIEWLLRRYSIERTNIRELLECVLPFHASNVFVRLVQLLQIDLHSTWHWLAAFQKSGQKVSRSVLVTQCTSDPAFLDFLLQLASSHLKFVRADGLDASSAEASARLQPVLALELGVLLELVQRSPATAPSLSALASHLLGALAFEGGGDAAQASDEVTGHRCADRLRVGLVLAAHVLMLHAHALEPSFVRDLRRAIGALHVSECAREIESLTSIIDRLLPTSTTIEDASS